MKTKYFKLIMIFALTIIFVLLISNIYLTDHSQDEYLCVEYDQINEYLIENSSLYIYVRNVEEECEEIDKIVKESNVDLNQNTICVNYSDSLHETFRTFFTDYKEISQLSQLIYIEDNMIISTLTLNSEINSNDVTDFILVNSND